jgi:predicted signal transduction protein with EAL and GGDEF domain
VLVEISERLQDFVRNEDTVARLGGDEFVLLLTDLTDEEGSEPILTRLLEIVTKPCELQNGARVNVSASIGVTFYPNDHNDPDVLLRHADQAMYQAKQLGRNRMHHFDPKYDQQTRKLRDLKTKVRAGLEQTEFVLYWQPKVDLMHGHVVGAEALLRWWQPDATVILPGAYLPQLENDDLIIEIGDYVIKEAIATLSRWHELGINMSASVNVAARQMLAPEFMRKLREALEGRRDLARHLELEILETVALEDLDKVKRLINECRALGVGTALDDFGTGYSSMTYFRRLPVDTVKIDQSFVRDMLDNADDLAIVQGVLGLTKAFGKTSVAEGVELVEQLAVLQGMGCHIAQGYAIGYPMPEHEFLRWLENYKPDNSWALGL